jgi:hypothetical protein
MKPSTSVDMIREYTMVPLQKLFNLIGFLH